MAPSKDKEKQHFNLNSTIKVQSTNATLFLDWNDVILLHQLSAICLVAELTFCGL